MSGGSYAAEVSWQLMDVQGEVFVEGGAGTVSMCPACQDVTVIVSTQGFGSEVTWQVDAGPIYGPYQDNGEFAEHICIFEGAHALNYFDDYGDGWGGGTIEVAGFLAPVAVEGFGGTSVFSLEPLCQDVTVSLDMGGCWAGENTWSIDSGEVYGPYSDNQEDSESVCLDVGSHTLFTFDSFGDGWNCGSTIEVVNFVAAFSPSGSGDITAFEIGSASGATCADWDLHLFSLYGMGWGDVSLSVFDCRNTVVTGPVTLDDGAEQISLDLCIPAAHGYRIVVTGGSWQTEVGWSLTDNFNTVLLEGGAGFDDWVGECPCTNEPDQWRVHLPGSRWNVSRCNSTEVAHGMTAETVDYAPGSHIICLPPTDLPLACEHNDWALHLTDDQGNGCECTASTLACSLLQSNISWRMHREW